MGVGNVNKNVFHIFGIDILIDSNGKPWLLEINASPSLNMYVQQSVADSDDEEESKLEKVLSKLDKDVKCKIIKDAISIAWGNFSPSSSTFEKIYTSDDDP